MVQLSFSLLSFLTESVQLRNVKVEKVTEFRQLFYLQLLLITEKISYLN